MKEYLMPIVLLILFVSLLAGADAQSWPEIEADQQLYPVIFTELP